MGKGVACKTPLLDLFFLACSSFLSGAAALIYQILFIELVSILEGTTVLSEVLTFTGFLFELNVGAIRMPNQPPPGNGPFPAGNPFPSTHDSVSSTKIVCILLTNISAFNRTVLDEVMASIEPIEFSGYTEENHFPHQQRQERMVRFGINKNRDFLLGI